MAHCLDGCGHIHPWTGPAAVVPDHYGNDGRVAEAAALDMAERTARATIVLAEPAPVLPTRIVLPNSVRRPQGA